MVAPSTIDLDQLARAFAVAGHLFGKIGEHLEERLGKAFRRGSLARLIFGAPFAAAAPVAKASSVSDVEVSLSMVTALKVSSTPLLSSDCSTADDSGASVNTKDSMVAMSGAIMPAPLAMPLQALTWRRRDPPSPSRPSETCRWS